MNDNHSGRSYFCRSWQGCRDALLRRIRLIGKKTFDELDKFIPGFFEGLSEQIKRARFDYGRCFVIRNYMWEYLYEHCVDEAFDDSERITAYCGIENYLRFDRMDTDCSGQSFGTLYDQYLKDYPKTDIALWSMTDPEDIFYIAQSKRNNEDNNSVLKNLDLGSRFEKRLIQHRKHEEYARTNVDHPRIDTVSQYVRDYINLCYILASDEGEGSEIVRIFTHLIKSLDSLLEKEAILIGKQKIAVTDCYFTVDSRPDQIPVDGHHEDVWKMVFDSLGSKTLYIAYILYMTDKVNAMRRHQDLLGFLRRMYIHIKLHLYDRPEPISEDDLFYEIRLEAGDITNEMTIAEAVRAYAGYRKLKNMNAEDLCRKIDELITGEFDRIGLSRVPEEIEEMRPAIRGFDAITDEVMNGGISALNSLTYSDFRIDKDEEVGHNETADLVTRCSCKSGAKKNGEKKIDIIIGLFDTVISHVFQDNWLDEFDKEMFSDRFVHRSESNYALGPVRRLSELKANMFRRDELYSETVENDPFADMLYYESDIFDWDEDTEEQQDHQICLQHARESLAVNIANYIGSVIEDIHSRMKVYALIHNDVKLLSEVWPEYTDIAGIEYAPEWIGRLDEYRDRVYT